MNKEFANTFRKISNRMCYERKILKFPNLEFERKVYRGKRLSLNKTGIQMNTYE